MEATIDLKQLTNYVTEKYALVGIYLEPSFVEINFNVFRNDSLLGTIEAYLMDDEKGKVRTKIGKLIPLTLQV